MALYTVLSNPIQIEIKIHNDSVIFRTDREFQFIELFVDGDTEMYPIRNPLPSVTHPTTGADYPLVEICSESTFLYQRQHSLSTFACLKASAPRKYCNLSAIIKSITVPELGIFQSFSDGRIKVAFEDRTILEIDANSSIAKVFDSGGDVTLVRLDRVVAYKWYISCAMSFKKWTNGEEQDKIDGLIQEVTNRNLQFLNKLNI